MSTYSDQYAVGDTYNVLSISGRIGVYYIGFYFFLVHHLDQNLGLVLFSIA